MGFQNFNVLHIELQERYIGAVNLGFGVDLKDAENAAAGSIADGNQTVPIAYFIGCYSGDG